MDELTDRQREILNFILKETESRGFPPTIREIGEQMDIRSTNGVNDHLKALERKGYLLRGEQQSRALVPTKRARLVLGLGARKGDADLLEIPVLGKVAAGAPLLAAENIEDSVKIDSFFLGSSGKEVFALRVKGQSMIEDGIFDGDYLFVKKTPSANPGDIVVALIEDEATVKRYYPEGDRVRFQPANSTMQPIYVHKSEFRSTMILGLVVGVYRKLALPGAKPVLRRPE